MSEPHQLRQPLITVAIPRGATFEDALTMLSREDVLSDPLPLRVYLKVTASAPIVQAGSYQFRSPISPLGVVDVLRGGAHSEKLTIVEGWTRFDIARAMNTVPALKLKTDIEALPLMSDRSLVADIDPLARNLEGYLYPDTYFIVANMTPQEVVRGMVTRFRKVWKEHLAATAYNRKVSIHEVVTVASIIETEAKLASERPVVASVVYNRLAKGMPLGVDSTIVYAAKIDGKWRGDGKVYQSDIDRRSPYNTRIFKGLPPGPVGSPGLASLLAAVNPAQTNFLYYVRNPYRDDGAHNFYATAAEFEKGVATLRNWEQKRAQNPQPSQTPVSASAPTSAPAPATTAAATTAATAAAVTAATGYIKNPLSAQQPQSSQSQTAKSAQSGKPAQQANPAQQAKPAQKAKSTQQAKSAQSTKSTASQMKSQPKKSQVKKRGSSAKKQPQKRRRRR